MSLNSNRWTPRRAGAMAVAAAMLLNTVVPAYAVVSQLPGLYITPPPSNVMFTLDDSGSMLSEAIPDFFDAGYAGLTTPADDDSYHIYLTEPCIAFDRRGRCTQYTTQRKFPNLFGQNSAFFSATYYARSNALARYIRSSAGNPLYYDPTVRYVPWPDPTDDTRPSANAAIFAGTNTPTQVRISNDSPFAGGYLLDIKTRRGSADESNEANGFWPATYFVYTGTTPLPSAAPNALLNAPFNNVNLFTKVEIKPAVDTYARAASRTDCDPTNCNYNQELQNFANWLQYYRSRSLMAKGGVASAFSKQKDNLRVGFGSINSANTVRRGVLPFTGTARRDFYNDLYPLVVNGGTPLRKAADDVGKYFQRTGAGNPWANDMASTSSTPAEYTCRKSIHILSTDGYWNGDPASSPANGNADRFSGNTPPKGPSTGTTYAFSDSTATTADPLFGRFGISPFQDGASDRLSDAAAYYWRNDLRPDLANDVSPSARDPAFWQHLSTYTVGLGITGTGNVQRASDSSTVVPAGEATTSPFYAYRGRPWLDSQPLRDLLIANKVPLNWTNATANSANTGDDLVHASMSSRGRYFSATNPVSLASGLSAALAEASDNPGSLASVVAESPSVSTATSTTEVYQATYSPGDQWSGRLYSFAQATSGAVNTTPSTALWEASNRMPAPSARNIYTWNPTLGVGSTFTWGGLTSAQQASLGGDTTLLEYLRGSDAREAAKGGPFRDRSRYTVGSVAGGVLGDIINGSPIKGPSAGGGFERLPSGSDGQASYATYRAAGNTALDNMRDTIFVGANDGMLHAFNRNTGVERFAFVPNSVFSVPRSLTGTEQKLRMLSDPDYAHRYTVDGPPQIGDAFIGPSAAASTWKTVLLGSTGAGARSVFAMDISDPAVSSTAFGPSKLLWEFSEANNTDMGYVLGYPHIARMRNGAWVAIFGNGYDSASGRAKLFILNLQTGVVEWEQSVGPAGGNGLSQPNFTVNANREVTGIYAGDLRGNLWKFDVDNADRAQWRVAFGGAPNYTPLFAGSANQPIAVMPELTYHPNGGVMVSFGTGKLFETEDTATTSANINLNTQAIYGIWDKPSETTGFSGNSTLVQQGMNTALAAAANASANLTGTTSNPVDWATRRGWFINLNTGGERVNVNPQQAQVTLLVVANTPDSDPCSSGGASRLFGLDPITGGAPTFGVFNSNNDTTINSADRGYNVKSISFAVLSLPTLQNKRNVVDAITTEKAGSRGQTGDRLGGVENKPLAPRGASDCAAWLLAGASGGTIEGFDVSLCSAGKPRVSWRQLK